MGRRVCQHQHQWPIRQQWKEPGSRVTVSLFGIFAVPVGPTSAATHTIPVGARSDGRRWRKDQNKAATTTVRWQSEKDSSEQWWRSAVDATTESFSRDQFAEQSGSLRTAAAQPPPQRPVGTTTAAATTAK